MPIPSCATRPAARRSPTCAWPSTTDRRGQDGEWQEETQWFRVELWEQAAERAAEQLRKGHKVYAEGQLRAREYEGNDGQKRTSLEIRFARVLSLERREPGEEGGGFAR